jgi:hypothetical protein
MKVLGIGSTVNVGEEQWTCTGFKFFCHSGWFVTLTGQDDEVNLTLKEVEDLIFG